MRNHESTTWASSDPPPLIEENGGLEGQQMSTQLNSLEQQQMSTQSNSMERLDNLKTHNTMVDEDEDEGNDRATRQTQKQKQYVQKPIDSYFKQTTNDMKSICLFTQEEMKKE